MMLLFLVVLTICLAGALHRSTFLSLIFTLHAVPALTFLTGMVSPLTTVHYGAAYLLLLGCGLCCLPRNFKIRDDLFVTGLLLLMWVLFFILFMRWQEMFALGERLRDMALLTITDRDPISPDEPWFPGTPVPYYLYWYRWARFCRSLGDFSLISSYHCVLAFSASLLFTSSYAIARSIFVLGRYSSAGAACIVTLGSNSAGILDVAYQATTWWGPSRVIRGAITEFPAWSFLLGDAHPHVLNLGSSLFFLFCALLLIRLRPSRKAFITLATLSLLLLTFLKAANPWEIPLWFGLLGVLTVSWLLVWSASSTSQHTGDAPREIGYLVSWLLCLLLSVCLYRSIEHLPASALAPSMVTANIAKTTARELFLHWGIPLTCIVIATLATSISWFYRVCIIFMVLCSLLAVEARFFLLVLLGLLAFYAKNEFNRLLAEPYSWCRLTLITTLILYITIPEFIFLNDPYDGDYERMNTIFKIYSFVWAPLLILTSTWVIEIVQRTKGSVRLTCSGILLLVCVIELLFFIRTATLLRPQKGWRTDVPQEFTVLEDRYPGVTEVVLLLRKLPVSTVLEPQGPAYHYTSFLSSLSGHYSFLGWANHINLLTKRYDEVRHRQEVSAQIYNPRTPCAKKLELMKSAQIDILAYGYNEHGPRIIRNEQSFSCLPELLRTRSITLRASPESHLIPLAKASPER